MRARKERGGMGSLMCWRGAPYRSGLRLQKKATTSPAAGCCVSLSMPPAPLAAGENACQLTSFKRTQDSRHHCIISSQVLLSNRSPFPKYAAFNNKRITWGARISPSQHQPYVRERSRPFRLVCGLLLGISEWTVWPHKFKEPSFTAAFILIAVWAAISKAAL